MRRLQSFPAPVASISGLQDQLQQTDWTVEDGELCFLRPTRQLFEFRKGVTSPAANGITTVQASLPGVVGQWALLADSDQNVVYFSPQGGGADDWPALNTLMAAVAGQKMIVFTAGTYTCATPGVVPAGTTLVLNSGVIINSTMVPSVGGGVTQDIFSGFAAFNATSTTLTANAVVGAKTFSVTSVSAPAIANGSTIFVSTTFCGQCYTVTNVAGGGPFTVTVDRPIVHAWPSATATVQLVTKRPTDIYIYGGGATIQGTGDRLIEFAGSKDVHIYDLKLNGTAGIIPASFDVGSYHCHMERVYAVAGVGATDGLMLESCENCMIDESSSSNYNSNIDLWDSWLCELRNCETVGGAFGLDVSSDGVSTVDACVDCRIIGGSYEGASSYGIKVASSRRILIQNVAARYNTNAQIVLLTAPGVSYDTTLDGVVTDGGSYGVQIQLGVKGTRLTDCTLLGASNTGLSAADEFWAVNYICRGCSWGLQAALAPGLKGFVSNALFQPIALGGGIGVLAQGGGKLFIEGATIDLVSVATTGIDIVDTTTVVSIDNVRFINPPGGATGVLRTGASALLRLGRGIDFGTVATPVQAGIVSSRGTVTLVNGGGAVTYAFADIKANDDVTVTRQTIHGTPLSFSWAISAGVGVVVTGTATDTSDIYVSIN